MIKENITQIQNKISETCLNCGRSQEDVTLIAVSKTKPVKAIREAISAGMCDFGENKVQELCDKIEVISEDVRWHLIGHLQTNKVKYIIGKTFLIHSVDSVRLARKIQDEAAKKQTDVDILIQVNVAEEETKFGFAVEELPEAVEEIAKFPNVHIKGLMTIAPFSESGEQNRPFFRKLRQLSVDISDKNIDNVNMSVLSMGMSHDFTTAIEEGATYVRVGTNIFGERNYNI